MSRGTQVSLQVQREVERLMINEGVTSKAQIYGELQRLGLIDRGGSPSKSTIDRMVDRLTSSDQSGRWSFAEADPEDAQLVLDVFLFVLKRTQGRVWLSKDTAEWIARLRRTFSEMPPAWAYIFGQTYQRARTDPPLLDVMLALKPWEDNDDPSSWGVSVSEDQRGTQAFELLAAVLIDLVRDLEGKPLRLEQARDQISQAHPEVSVSRKAEAAY